MRRKPMKRADNLIFQTEKQLKEYGDKIPAVKKAPIEEALTKLKAAHKSEDLDAINTVEAELNAAWMAASEEMYKAGQNPADAQSGAHQAPNDGGVADAEYEEVK